MRRHVAESSKRHLMPLPKHPDLDDDAGGKRARGKRHKEEERPLHVASEPTTLERKYELKNDLASTTSRIDALVADYDRSDAILAGGAPLVGPEERKYVESILSDSAATKRSLKNALLDVSEWQRTMTDARLVETVEAEAEVAQLQKSMRSGWDLLTEAHTHSKKTLGMLEKAVTKAKEDGAKAATDAMEKSKNSGDLRKTGAARHARELKGLQAEVEKLTHQLAIAHDGIARADAHGESMAKMARDAKDSAQTIKEEYGHELDQLNALVANFQQADRIAHLGWRDAQAKAALDEIQDLSNSKDSPAELKRVREQLCANQIFNPTSMPRRTEKAKNAAPAVVAAPAPAADAPDLSWDLDRARETIADLEQQLGMKTSELEFVRTSAERAEYAKKKPAEDAAPSVTKEEVAALEGERDALQAQVEAAQTKLADLAKKAEFKVAELKRLDDRKKTAEAAVERLNGEQADLMATQEKTQDATARMQKKLEDARKAGKKEAPKEEVKAEAPLELQIDDQGSVASSVSLDNGSPGKKKNPEALAYSQAMDALVSVMPEPVREAVLAGYKEKIKTEKAEAKAIAKAEMLSSLESNRGDPRASRAIKNNARASAANWRNIRATAKMGRGTKKKREMVGYKKKDRTPKVNPYAKAAKEKEERAAARKDAPRVAAPRRRLRRLGDGAPSSDSGDERPGAEARGGRSAASGRTGSAGEGLPPIESVDDDDDDDEEDFDDSYPESYAGSEADEPFVRPSEVFGSSRLQTNASWDDVVGEDRLSNRGAFREETPEHDGGRLTNSFDEYEDEDDDSFVEIDEEDEQRRSSLCGRDLAKIHEDYHANDGANLEEDDHEDLHHAIVNDDDHAFVHGQIEEIYAARVKADLDAVKEKLAKTEGELDAERQEKLELATKSAEQAREIAELNLGPAAEHLVAEQIDGQVSEEDVKKERSKSFKDIGKKMTNSRSLLKKFAGKKKKKAEDADGAAASPVQPDDPPPYDDPDAAIDPATGDPEGFFIPVDDEGNAIPGVAPVRWGDPTGPKYGSDNTHVRYVRVSSLPQVEGERPKSVGRPFFAFEYAEALQRSSARRRPSAATPPNAAGRAPTPSEALNAGGATGAAKGGVTLEDGGDSEEALLKPKTPGTVAGGLSKAESSLTLEDSSRVSVVDGASAAKAAEHAPEPPPGSDPTSRDDGRRRAPGTVDASRASTAAASSTAASLHGDDAEAPAAAPDAVAAAPAPRAAAAPAARAALGAAAEAEASRASTAAASGRGAGGARRRGGEPSTAAASEASEQAALDAPTEAAEPPREAAAAAPPEPEVRVVEKQTVRLMKDPAAELEIRRLQKELEQMHKAAAQSMAALSRKTGVNVAAALEASKHVFKEEKVRGDAAKKDVAAKVVEIVADRAGIEAADRDEIAELIVLHDYVEGVEAVVENVKSGVDAAKATRVSRAKDGRRVSVAARPGSMKQVPAAPEPRETAGAEAPPVEDVPAAAEPPKEKVIEAHEVAHRDPEEDPTEPQILAPHVSHKAGEELHHLAQGQDMINVSVDIGNRGPRGMSAADKATIAKLESHVAQLRACMEKQQEAMLAAAMTRFDQPPKSKWANLHKLMAEVQIDSDDDDDDDDDRAELKEVDQSAVARFASQIEGFQMANRTEPTQAAAGDLEITGHKSKHIDEEGDDEPIPLNSILEELRRSKFTRPQKETRSRGRRRRGPRARGRARRADQRHARGPPRAARPHARDGRADRALRQAGERRAPPRDLADDAEHEAPIEEYHAEAVDAEDAAWDVVDEQRAELTASKLTLKQALNRSRMAITTANRLRKMKKFQDMDPESRGSLKFTDAERTILADDAAEKQGKAMEIAAGTVEQMMTGAFNPLTAKKVRAKAKKLAAKTGVVEAPDGHVDVDEETMKHLREHENARIQAQLKQLRSIIPKEDGGDTTDADNVQLHLNQLSALALAAGVNPQAVAQLNPYAAAPAPKKKKLKLNFTPLHTDAPQTARKDEPPEVIEPDDEYEEAEETTVNVDRMVNQLFDIADGGLDDIGEDEEEDFAYEGFGQPISVNAMSSSIVGHVARLSAPSVDGAEKAAEEFFERAAQNEAEESLRDDVIEEEDEDDEPEEEDDDGPLPRESTRSVRELMRKGKKKSPKEIRQEQEMKKLQKELVDARLQLERLNEDKRARGMRAAAGAAAAMQGYRRSGRKQGSLKTAGFSFGRPPADASGETTVVYRDPRLDDIKTYDGVLQSMLSEIRSNVNAESDASERAAADAQANRATTSRMSKYGANIESQLNELAAVMAERQNVLASVMRGAPPAMPTRIIKVGAKKKKGRNSAKGFKGFVPPGAMLPGQDNGRQSMKADAHTRSRRRPRRRRRSPARRPTKAARS
ncbi:hypothetical protein JL721_6624 [Aureococcus anophagefferens]|nr:hypothetical protein JL721_6624 [Aureococcus anophagefferens]